MIYLYHIQAIGKGYFTLREDNSGSVSELSEKVSFLHSSLELDIKIIGMHRMKKTIGTI
ncbi:MAG: hypothetical protein ACLP29_10460 [Dissulfurispiraceae bacterium]